MLPICRFDDVTEHDMDMLFLEELVVSQDFLNIFTSKIGVFDASVIEIEHSKVHPEFGETDMTVIIETQGKRHGLLIEDKICANARPEQCSRYIKRGEFGVNNGDYSSFDVFIVAPEKYLEENTEAQKYPIKVKYEECIEYFTKNIDNRKHFKLCQIKQAIHKQRYGYQIIENKAVTDFWSKYIAFQKANFPHLYLTATEGPKGAKSTWAHYNTPIEKLYIIHKSEKGFVDLTIPDMSGRLTQLEMLLNDMIDLKENGMSVHPTGKAAAIRMIVPKLDFKKSFENQYADIEECINAIEKMHETVKHFDAAKLRLFMETKQ